MQDLARHIADDYGMEIKNIMPFKDTYLITSSKGKMLLKKSVLQPERIMFIHGAKEHLFNNGFIGTDRNIYTLEGLPYSEFEERYYTLHNAIDGRECNFDSNSDIVKASRMLAEFHAASRGYIPPENSIVRNELGNLPSYFGKRLEEIKKLKKAARKAKSKFDYLFLEHVDYFYELGDSAIKAISGSAYNSVIELCREEKSFCHHDFTHHNIVCNNDGFHLINFDYCCYEIRVYDIANFLRRKMRKCNWDAKEAEVIFKEYGTIEKLSDDEIYVMKIILQFPQKFWRVANKYYNSKRSWSEKSYLFKLQEVVDEIKYHREFLNKYDALF